MHNMLNKIIAQKHIEVSILKNNAPVLPTPCDLEKSFKQAISGEQLSFIGEIKRKSPSKGKLSAILDPIALLQAYLEGEISAVSVLTDQPYFSGSIHDLEDIAAYLNQSNQSNIPILRKDFIIDEVQIIESIAAGADAILLIVSVLQDKTRDLLRCAKQLGIDAIVEVHDLDELKFAIDISAEIIGINNRNLDTFEEDINICLHLAQHIPDHILKIAESSIKTPDDIKKINQAGFDAVLIGEALVTAEKPAVILGQMRGAL
jgi:indole-3-glycerol phosphate synthase